MNKASSQRGKGTCPQCKETYTNRYKPKVCVCGFLLGGSFVPRHPKKPKLDVPLCSSVVLGPWNVYSCKTSTHDDRCLVIKYIGQGESIICQHNKCKQARALMVNSDSLGGFTCEHIDSLKSASSPTNCYFRLANLGEYQCSDTVRNELARLETDCVSGNLPLAVQVSPTMFCVFGPATTNATAGYSHVRVTKESLRCCSKDCKTFIARAKQHKAKNICIHVHIIISLGLFATTDEPAEEVHAMASTSAASTASAAPAATPLETGSYELCDTVSRKSTVQLNMRRSLPLNIPTAVFKQAQLMDINGWPPSLSPSCTTCGLCGSPLSQERGHPGQRGDSVIITSLNPFRPLKLYVKFCQRPSCQAMHQVFPYDIGLFNVCDKVVVSLEILVEWRQLFLRGVPISTAIESKIQAMASRVEDHPTENELQNICKLLYNGFYCFEAITVRSLDDTICGICGNIGELYLGDGNEKNCCSISEIDYTPRQVASNGSTSLEDFLLGLKERWVESTTYTRCSQKVKFHHSEIPPIIAPSIRRLEVLNTEAQKKSTVLDSMKQNYQGDPALLHRLIRGKEFDFSEMEQSTLDRIKEICQRCNIPTAHKSLERLKIDLQGLYASVLVGKCPCHGFTKVDGHTGGFYHIVCRHGVTAASKFLTLQESVRDPGDLYLSFKHYPLVFICDTPCGFVRHMDCREPEIAKHLWGDSSGCLETPTLGKTPTEGISVPEIVPAEYRDCSRTIPSADHDKNKMSHPLTGSERRYVLGDRFHNASNPHKSELCQFHDINLCLQSNVLKTSYQESENHRKNSLRLRSSCVQGFSTHYLYNYLMDFYQNEEIVKKQRTMFEKKLKDGQCIKRDDFFRFVVCSTNTNSCS